jgi:hypothetical protein
VLVAAAALVAPAGAGIGMGGTTTPAGAATPPSGTVGTGRPAAEWTGPGRTAATALPPGGDPTKAQLDIACAAPGAFCDDFGLTVVGGSGDVTVTMSWPIFTDDFALFVFDPQGTSVSGTRSSATDSETLVLAHPSGSFVVRVVYRATFGTGYFGRASVAGSATGGVSRLTPPPDLARFQTYRPPNGLGGKAGEPTLGADWRNGDVFYEAQLETLRVRFDDCTSPARATWTDRSPPTSVNTFDPILFVDSESGPDRPSRCFVSHLAGKTSLMSFSDDGGETWTPSQGGGLNSGVDHQSLGAGPYAPGFGLPAPGQPYPRAVYYCSQDVATSYCARSDTGGLTFGPAVPIWRTDECGGVHGHPKVAPDGTVYVPNHQCGITGAAGQTVSVSEDNGVTWNVRPVVPGSIAGEDDPSVSVATDGTVYFGYKNGDGRPHMALSKDKGRTWIRDQVVGADLGIVNSVFPAVIAGDPDRAAYAFIGTTTPGDHEDFANFHGEWHLYVAMTYDGGLTWRTVDTTPDDPVQRGSICQQGTLCFNPKDDRNLLDFMDATVDREGRVLVAYPDGCIDACVAGGDNSYTSRASMARQSGGRRLFAAYDPPLVSLPGTPSPTVREAGRGVTELTWVPPDDGGSPITEYRVQRAPAADGPFATIATTAGTRYVDQRAPGSVAYYRVVAVNAVGESRTCAAALSAGLTASCSPPGPAVLQDATGDAQDGQPAHDVVDLAVSEPYLGPGLDRLVVTLHVSSLSTLTPDTTWTALFRTPDGVGRALMMQTDASSTPTFVYGTAADDGRGGYGAVTPLGSLDPGTGYQANGTITFVVDKAKVGVPAAGASLGGFLGRVRLEGANRNFFAPDRVPDDAAGASNYALVGNVACQPTGYWLAASDGGIFTFGDARFFGSLGGVRLNRPVVGLAPTVTGAGYWMVAADGGVFPFGDARFRGSTGALRLNKPIVGMAPTPSGGGYWLVASDGGVFSFGDAAFRGSTGALRLNKPIVGMAATPSGGGYWLVASDGGVFAFGDARFVGSTGAIRLNRPVVGMAADPGGTGYWLVASDGGIFAFGSAAFAGSTGAIRLNQPVVGMAATPSGRGYWLGGAVFAFPSAPFLGSMGAVRLNAPIVGLAAARAVA